MKPLLQRVSESIATAGTLEQLARPFLEMLELVTGLESTYLTSIDLERGLQHVVFARNSRDLQIPEGLSVAWSDTLCKRALDEGRAYTSDVACWGDSDAARTLGIQTYASMPVRMSDGQLFGTLCAASSQPRPLSQEGEQFLRLFAQLIGQHVERERLMEQLKKANEELSTQALTDLLTGLPNRRALVEELGRAIPRARRANSFLLVGFVDLDGFKQINDQHGHEAGDRLLSAVANRLAAGLRAGDMLARLGGDEFIVLGQGPQLSQAGCNGTQQLGQRLANATIGRFDLGTVEIDYAGASVGVACIDPRSATAESALRDADQAMYEVKALRRGG